MVSQLAGNPTARAVSAWNRRRKWNHFQEIHFTSPDTTILDVGFSPREYSAADNYLEKHYPHLGRVTALMLAREGATECDYPGLSIVEYDGKTFPFATNTFDIVWSNAVLEHVGSDAAQVTFLREIDRVGTRHFVTTPNRWFPIEPHTRTPFLHWLPKPTFDRYLHRTGQDWAAGDYMHLLSGRRLHRLLGEAGIKEYRLIRNRLGPVLDFVVSW